MDVSAEAVRSSAVLAQENSARLRSTMKVFLMGVGFDDVANLGLAFLGKIDVW